MITVELLGERTLTSVCSENIRLSLSVMENPLLYYVISDKRLYYMYRLHPTLITILDMLRPEGFQDIAQ